ncbi:hypothetical protein BURK1_01833 [Burkholderiales bacterium]|nr:hypothetical protein BURK1_01833 [Burkholderiales bacterium]
MRIALLAAWFAAVAPALALDAHPGARAITFDGERLVHAADGTTPVERWREFVPAGEKIERWTRLASLREYPSHDDPKALAGNLVRALRRQNPEAPSSIIENPATGEVIVDFVTWPADRAFIEFNLFRYGRRDGGGTVAQQYALRHYGEATAFLRGLKAERPRLVDLMAREGLRAAR